jgi:hypothetical protein
MDGGNAVEFAVAEYRVARCVCPARLEVFDLTFIIAAVEVVMLM